MLMCKCTVLYYNTRHQWYRCCSECVREAPRVYVSSHDTVGTSTLCRQHEGSCDSSPPPAFCLRPQHHAKHAITWVLAYMLLRTVYGLPPPPPPVLPHRNEQPWRRGLSGSSGVRHDAVRPTRHLHHRYGTGGIHGLASFNGGVTGHANDTSEREGKQNKGNRVGVACHMWRAAQSRQPRSLLFHIFPIWWSQSASAPCFHRVFMRRLPNTRG